MENKTLYLNEISTCLHVFFEVADCSNETVPLHLRHEEVLLCRIPSPLIRVECAYANAQMASTLMSYRRY